MGRRSRLSLTVCTCVSVCACVWGLSCGVFVSVLSISTLAHLEECGDGIMSAIDMYATIDTVVGKQVRPALLLYKSGPLHARWSYDLKLLFAGGKAGGGDFQRQVPAIRRGERGG